MASRRVASARSKQQDSLRLFQRQAPRGQPGRRSRRSAITRSTQALNRVVDASATKAGTGSNEDATGATGARR